MLLRLLRPEQVDEVSERPRTTLEQTPKCVKRKCSPNANDLPPATQNAVATWPPRNPSDVRDWVTLGVAPHFCRWVAVVSDNFGDVC